NHWAATGLSDLKTDTGKTVYRVGLPGTPRRTIRSTPLATRDRTARLADHRDIPPRLARSSKPARAVPSGRGALIRIRQTARRACRRQGRAPLIGEGGEVAEPFAIVAFLVRRFLFCLCC